MIYLDNKHVNVTICMQYMWPIKCVHLKSQIPSRQVRAHTYIKQNRSGFWYLYSIGFMGVSTFPNSNKLFCKIWIINFIITKFCKAALTSTMCTSVHMSIHGVMCMNMRSMCMPWFVGGACFLWHMDSNRVWFMAHWLKVEPKQSTLFLKHIYHFQS